MKSSRTAALPDIATHPEIATHPDMASQRVAKAKEDLCANFATWLCIYKISSLLYVVCVLQCVHRCVFVGVCGCLWVFVGVCG